MKEAEKIEMTVYIPRDVPFDQVTDEMVYKAAAKQLKAQGIKWTGIDKGRLAITVTQEPDAELRKLLEAPDKSPAIRAE